MRLKLRDWHGSDEARVSQLKQVLLLHLVDKLDTRLSHVGVSSLLVSRETLKQRDSCHQGMYPLPAHLIFFVCVSLCPVSVYPSLSVCLSVCLSLSLSLSVCLPASVSVYICLSVCLSVCLSLPLSLSLSPLFSRCIDDLASIAREKYIC